MQNEDQNVYEIDILELIVILLRRWWIIFIASVVCAAGAFVYTHEFVTPMYQTSVMLYVNNSSLSLGSSKLDLTTGDIQASQALVKTYGVILSSNLTLQDVADSLNKNSNINGTYTYKDLKKLIKSEAANGTEIMKITVTCADPSDAVYIANTVAEVLPKRISRIVDGTSVTVVDLAEFPEEASSPSYSKNTIIGLVIGFVLSVGAILVYNIFIYDSVDSEDWIRNTFKDELPILAIIPEIGGKHRRHSRHKSYIGYYSNIEDIDMLGSANKEGGNL